MMMNSNPNEYAIAQLAEQLAYMDRELANARIEGDNKAFAALMRVYLPTMKEYIRLTREQAGERYTDELLEFARAN